MPRVTSAYASNTIKFGKRRVQFSVPLPLHEYLTRFSLATGVPRTKLFLAYVDWLLDGGHVLGFEERPEDENAVTGKPRKLISLFLPPEKERTFRKFLIDHQLNMTDLFCRYTLWIAKGNPPIGMEIEGLKEEIKI